MKETVKCSRCGKEFDFRGKKVSEMISCDHCHLQMKISEKTQKHFKLVRYLFLFGVCLVIAFGMNAVTQNNYLLLLATLFVAMFLSSFADHLCLYLTDKIFGLQYEAYQPVKISKKEKRKQNTEKKKGLFSREK